MDRIRFHANNGLAIPPLHFRKDSVLLLPIAGVVGPALVCAAADDDDYYFYHCYSVALLLTKDTAVVVAASVVGGDSVDAANRECRVAFESRQHLELNWRGRTIASKSLEGQSFFN